jgi:predicted RNA-binding protein with TRAM domain
MTNRRILSFPLRSSQVIFHTAMMASSDGPKGRHAGVMDEGTTTRPASRRSIKISADGLTVEVQVTDVTSKGPELTVITGGTVFVTDIIVKTSSREKKRRSSVLHELDDFGWDDIQCAGHS